MITHTPLVDSNSPNKVLRQWATNNIHVHVGTKIFIIFMYVPEWVLVLLGHPWAEEGPGWSPWGWTHSEPEGRTCHRALLDSTCRSRGRQSYGCCTQSRTTAPSGTYDLWTSDQWRLLVRTVGWGSRAAVWWGRDETQWWGNHQIGHHREHSATGTCSQVKSSTMNTDITHELLLSSINTEEEPLHYYSF
jgi:hypothetical protein